MKLVERNVHDFIDLMASSAPAPGGGSAAALSGALGTALTAMVCALTVGRKKYADYEAQTQSALQNAEALKTRFLDIIDEDTEAFGAVSAVFSMPKDTEEEKSLRKSAMQEALKACTKTPFEMMRLSYQALEQLRSLVGCSNASAASDLGCAALHLRAAMEGAWLNVLINIGGIEDAAFAAQYRSEGEELLALARPLAESIYQDVLKSL